MGGLPIVIALAVLLAVVWAGGLHWLAVREREQWRMPPEWVPDERKDTP